MVRVAVIEEDEIYLQALKNFIIAQMELTCTQVCRSITYFTQGTIHCSSPHIIIIGSNLDAESKILPTQLKIIKEDHPNTEILILDDCMDSAKILNCLKAGVVGYLPRQTPPEQLIEAILGIRQGGAFVAPVMVRKMLEYFRIKKNLEEVLTDREQEIVQCLVEGMSYKLIAFNLNVALDTVRYHLRNIYKKLNVNSKYQVISKAVNSQK